MITKTFDGRTLVLVLENGLDAKGDPILIRKSVKYIAETATNDQIYSVATQLASLYVNPLSSVAIDEDFVLA